jgi:signal transduction histidine kinase
MIIVGILLIRSVIKEVKLREQVEKLAEDLQKANLGQSNLIHFMNHQVKGRFGNAKNIFAELLTDDYGTMPEDALPLLRKGLEETNMGVDYVQSILHGASAENGTLPYEMTDMNFKDLVEEVFAKQKDYAEKKGLKISLDVKNGDYLIKGDVTQLGEAVKNLIDNSVNYTMQGSIDVSLEAKDYIKLTIKDTGVGISPEDKPKLFKSGGRGENSLKINVNSTGYGLAFVKGVVDAHKGRVWAESEGANKGSIFYMELPKN